MWRPDVDIRHLLTLVLAESFCGTGTSKDLPVSTLLQHTLPVLEAGKLAQL